MKISIIFLFFSLVLTLPELKAQVKIGDNPNTIDSNSLLELESADKGFLPPRVALDDADLADPLSGTVPEGMLVYSIGGTLPDGYYFWNASRWVLISGESGYRSIYTTSTSDTLPKQDNFVLASGENILTLPVITSADNGMSITIKNVGTYMDLIQIRGNSGSVFDSLSLIPLPRWLSINFVAKDGSWLFDQRMMLSVNTLEVSWASSWRTIAEAIEFLDAHMTGPRLIRLGSGTFTVSETQVIDLPYSLTIEGTSFGTTTIVAASGLTNSSMFSCLSECYFKMLMFDGTTLANYGDNPDEDAIHLQTAGEYYEIKDCTFEGFNKAIVIENAVSLWLFENDFYNAIVAGVEIDADTNSNLVFRVSETDFISCSNGINLVSGNAATISMQNCGIYNTSGTDTGLYYNPTAFTNIQSVFITSNYWNNTGVFISGFDFSLADGRDANVFFEGNLGGGDKNPFCMISVVNNVATTTVTTMGTWYKANWTNTYSETIKWKIENNKITYLPSNSRGGYAIVTGNIAVNSANATATIAMAKNGNSAVRYGETDLRLKTANESYSFSAVFYLGDIMEGDYFELYCTTDGNGDIVTFLDVQWLTETK
ncbi:MAG: hypothetical protein ACYC1Q_05790 [Bacteroidia bacterium]